MIQNSRAVVKGLVFCACACALLTAAAAGAAAQPQENATAQNATGQDDATEVSDQLGDLIIHEYSYDQGDEMMTIEATWTGETPETLTLVEMIELDNEGTSDISFQRQRLLPDERTEIRVSAQQRSSGEAAILVNTPQSIERGEALVLQSGDPKTWPTITLDNAIAATGVSAAGAAALTFLLVVRRKNDEEYGVERKA